MIQYFSFSFAGNLIAMQYLIKLVPDHHPEVEAMSDTVCPDGKGF